MRFNYKSNENNTVKIFFYQKYGLIRYQEQSLLGQWKKNFVLNTVINRLNVPTCLNHEQFSFNAHCKSSSVKTLLENQF